MRTMTMPNLQVRRATVDDLPRLMALWKEDNLPVSELENRFKEFQVVAAEEGELLAAIGFQIAGFEGCLHSEVFAYPEQADILRERLWERAQVLAKNHGLVRIWTQLSTPYWHTNGLQTPPPEILGRLPGVWSGRPGNWLYQQLKEESGSGISLDAEFALFKEAEREQTEKLFRQARVMKLVAAVLGVAVFILVVVWAVMFMKAQGRLPKM